MNLNFLATVAKTTPVVIGVAVLVLLYLWFKVSKFVMKLLLACVVLAVMALAAWWFYSGHHGP